MLNSSLLGLPYVQLVGNGVLLDREGTTPRLTLRIFRWGSVLWTGNLVPIPPLFTLNFSEKPNGLKYCVSVEGNFGPRVSYIVWPVNVVFPIRHVGTKYQLTSRDIFLHSRFTDIVAQIRSAAAIHMALYRRKTVWSLPNQHPGSDS